MGMETAWIRLYGRKYVYGPGGWSGPVSGLTGVLNLDYSPRGAVGDPLAQAVAKAVKRWKLADSDWWVTPSVNKPEREGVVY